MDSAAVGAILNVLFDRLTSREFINFFLGRKDEEILLKKLKNKLWAVRPLLNDAELKQWADLAVKDWVDELKDAIYHADDLLDEIATEAMQSKLDSEFPTSSTTTTTTTQAIRDLVSWSPFGAEGRMSRIEQIIERLEDLVIAKESLGLREVDVGQNNQFHRLPPTTSLVDQVSVYGRDDDKEKIIQLLISDDDSSGHQVSVIPIVGMGGIGKTTLAQLVYNDPKVVDHFKIKSWVCVSEEFDILKVTKSILEELKLPHSVDNLNTLQVELRNGLAGKKFLIVLDDVWNEKYENWNRLRSPFAVGKHGSKIIVTTRNKDVASIMQTIPIFHVGQLSNEDCWLLFSKHAFVNVSPSVQSSLEPIGRKIVEKCKGLPLAAKTLGGLLRYKVEVEEWVNVLESHFWDFPNDKSDILPALLLSYHHLPSRLKLCFALCAIIPKDYEFKKDELVPLWIAEGFVEQPRTNRTIQEIGDGYFRELISRSLFQQSSGNCFSMHDLISDLAQFVAGEYCLRLEDDHPHDISKVRYISLYFNVRFDAVAKLISINKANCIRIFKLRKYDFSLTNSVLHDVLPTLRCLRVLSLHRNDIVELPDSIGNLIHLRHLDLSFTKIKCLPETISRLCNLETLLLQDCEYLTGLPQYLCKLICLRHLNITGTNLENMSMQIGRLRSLQCLTNFIVGKKIGSAISELRELHHLHGTLSISNLENVLNVRDALGANMKSKKHLESLNLVWGAEQIDDSQKERVVLEKLQPHINLKHLTIKNFGGTRFPDWLGDRSFLNLKSLCLRSCTNCDELPPLGQLPSLQELTIEGMNMVIKVGSEFYGYDSAAIKPFQSLEKLTFEDMPELEEWSMLGAGEFCHLLELYISDCPKLICKFSMQFPCLKKLVIENMELVTDPTTGAVPMQHLSSIQVLRIYNISELQCLPLELCRLINLKELVISRCPMLHTVQILPLELCRLTNLEELKIFNCSMLNTIQIIGGDHQTVSSQPEEEMKHVNTKFRSLEIENCPELELPLSEDTEHSYKFLQDVKIRGGSCNSLKSFPLGFFPKLRNLQIKKCRNLESLSELDGIQNLTSLQPLEIRDCPNLTSIRIHSCKKLKALPEQMCTLLPSLQSLLIWNLPEIESFPLGGLPSSLSSLTIRHCKKLMAGRKEWGLQRLPSLSYCKIGGECEEEEDKLLLLESSFPEECLLPTSLTYLYIENRPNMKSLNPNGLRHLNSLQYLWISDCPKLQSLPDEGLPSSLVSLQIRECPLLKARCQREKGEDWLKISHIPYIRVDGEQIQS